MQTKAKICGLTREEDILQAIRFGYSAIGLNFYQESPRYLSLEQSITLSRLVPDSVMKVGVFVNADEEYIRERITSCDLDAIQLHGDESPDFCKLFEGIIRIKGIRLKAGIDITPFDAVEYLLVDAYDEESFGGTGKTIPEELLKAFRFDTSRMILAGGLRAENVAEKIAAFCPAWVDVASGVEDIPGIKSTEKMLAFIKALSISRK
ncbi:UNVERIFIED_CONTAM: hypothetical protein GTU68_052919 [Idotea baltica]|nr:hypothetical protein [Idotea baltica]